MRGICVSLEKWTWLLQGPRFCSRAGRGFWAGLARFLAPDTDTELWPLKSWWWCSAEGMKALWTSCTSIIQVRRLLYSNKGDAICACNCILFLQTLAGYVIVSQIRSFLSCLGCQICCLLFAFFFYYKRLLTDEILAYIAGCTTPFCFLSNFLANCLQG